MNRLKIIELALEYGEACSSETGASCEGSFSDYEMAEEYRKRAWDALEEAINGSIIL